MSATTRGPAHKRQARILAMQALCQLDVQGGEFLEQIERFLIDAVAADDGVSAAVPPEEREAVRAHANRLAREVWAGQSRYDALLRTHVRNWEPGRIALVDRAILRLALYEMLADEQVPPRVAIDEAIELAKVYGSKDSPRFVNGVLDAVFRAEVKEATAPSSPA